MKKIFATTNQGIREVKMMMEDFGVDFVMKDAEIDIDIVEDENFEENAIIKAKTIMEATGEKLCR